MEELNTTNVITDMPGICEPGAEYAMERMLVFAKSARDQYSQEYLNAEGEQTRAFAKELYGQMNDQVNELRKRLTLLLEHYSTKLLDLQEAQKEMSLQDILEVQPVENRLLIRVNHLSRLLYHA